MLSFIPLICNTIFTYAPNENQFFRFPNSSTSVVAFLRAPEPLKEQVFLCSPEMYFSVVCCCYKDLGWCRLQVLYGCICLPFFFFSFHLLKQLVGDKPWNCILNLPLHLTSTMTLSTWFSISCYNSHKCFLNKAFNLLGQRPKRKLLTKS